MKIQNIQKFNYNNKPIFLAKNAYSTSASDISNEPLNGVQITPDSTKHLAQDKNNIYQISEIKQTWVQYATRVRTTKVQTKQSTRNTTKIQR